MGSTSYITKPKTSGFRMKSGSSVGSDKEMSGKLKRTKIRQVNLTNLIKKSLRRPSKMNEYGLKRIPDYTELAYKEAVSKLRYFLSGNYAPSVRSYGGSASIKNLDESDGDVDKKYTSPYTLAEYKSRPRLTAKYTTLYADSLNNYTPHHPTTPAPPLQTSASSAGADLSGGTNPDVINFIQKQEEYIEQLERESQYCRDELNNLLGKVKEVISENEHLHEAQKNKLISRMFHSYNGSESDELDELGDSTGLDSDNKITPSKARKSTKSRSTKLEGPNIVFESRIAELEAQLTQAKIDLKKVQDENNENKRKLASGLVDSTCLDGFKRQIDNLQRDKSSLESQISKLKLSLEQRDDDGRYKRGSDVVEHQLRDERNNLETEVRRLKDELAKERNKIREITGEGARRAIQERSAAEQRYNAHFDELQHDLAAQYDNVAKLQLDLERQRREENELKREISMKNSAIDDLKMELKNKMSSLQADLAQANAEKASLEEELASARLAIERHQRQAKHEANRLNSEIQSLRQRLDRADADLVHSRRENLRLSEQIANLEKEQTMKNLTPISPEKNKKDKEFSTMMESMENKHAKTVAELESMIQSQNSLMEKLTGECRLLTDKLDDANRRHKQELATLQHQVNGLTLSLQPPQTPSAYQAHPTHSTTSDRNSRRPSSNSGRDHPGAEPPGQPSVEPVGPITALPTIKRLHSNEASGINNDHAPEQIKHEMDNFNDEKNNTYDDKLAEHYKDTEFDEIDEIEQRAVKEINQEVENPMDVEPAQEYENQNYEYEENNEATQQAVDPQYQNQYDQNYEQPYTEQQQYENYEQYSQQYTDPNAQYDQQYENYQPNTNYESDQNYETSQYTQEYQTDQNPTAYQEGSIVQSDSKVDEQAYNTVNYAQESKTNKNTPQKQKILQQNGSRKTQIDKLSSQS